MSYFDYLKTTKKEDAQKTFKEYLIDVIGYEETIAIRESILYYM